MSANGAVEAWIEEDDGVGVGRPAAATAPAVTAEGESPAYDCAGRQGAEGDGGGGSANAREEEGQEARGDVAGVIDHEDAGAAEGVGREGGKKKKKQKKRKMGGEDKEGNVGRERGGSEGAEPEGCEEAGGVAAVAAAAAHDDDAQPEDFASTVEREEGDTIQEEEGDGGAPQTPRKEAGAAATCETPGGGQATPGGTRIADGRLVKVQREEYECMICLQTTGSGISLPCLHGPFCEGCLSVWSRHNRSCPCCRRKTGYDDDDCWVHLEVSSLLSLSLSLSLSHTHTHSLTHTHTLTHSHTHTHISTFPSLSPPPRPLFVFSVHLFACIFPSNILTMNEDTIDCPLFPARRVMFFLCFLV